MIEDMGTKDEREAAAEVELRDGNYMLSVFVAHGVTLSVEVERRSDGCRWRGDFNARYIEEITQRAGNVKSFQNFVKMLTAATNRHTSSSLFVDVLTYQDLEVLKEGKVVNKENSSSNVAVTDKRYLILTYTTEFDRVHYPLPLLHEEIQETAVMRRCMQRLRNELDFVKAQLRIHESPDSFEHRTKFTPSVSKDRENTLEMQKHDHYGTSERMHDSKEQATCKLLETRSLQKQVRGLQEKLRMEQISHKKSITTLVKKNTNLQDEARQARLVERRLSEKLRENEFQLNLLRGRLKSQEAANKTSPFRSRGRSSASPPPSRYSHQGRLRPSPSPPTSLYNLPYGRSYGLPPPRFPRPASRSSNSTPPPFRSSGGGSRSQSCPNLRVRKDVVEMNEWQGLERRPKPCASTTPTTPQRRRPSLQSRAPINHSTAIARQEEMDELANEVGEIDSRLYALRDYLKRMSGFGKNC